LTKPASRVYTITKGGDDMVQKSYEEINAKIKQGRICHIQPTTGIRERGWS
jgi:hypothetical protein